MVLAVRYEDIMVTFKGSLTASMIDRMEFERRELACCDSQG